MPSGEKKDTWEPSPGGQEGAFQEGQGGLTFEGLDLLWCGLGRVHAGYRSKDKASAAQHFLGILRSLEKG